MDNELYHWKYLKREKINGEWRYWYNKPSAQNTVTSPTSTATKINSWLNTGKSSLTNLAAKTNDVISTAKKNVHKYVEKVPTDGDTYRYFYSNEAYKAYVNGKNTADKASKDSVNTTASDYAKWNAALFVVNAMDKGFGRAVYDAVAPAFVSIKASMDTPKSFDELKKTNANQTNDEHQAVVNPYYNKSVKDGIAYNYDYSMNCSFCTAAYDLRKRGYDVEANPISIYEGYNMTDICSWYEGAKAVSETDIRRTVETNISSISYDDNRSQILENDLLKHGEGARGHLGVWWSNSGGGHDVVWEIEGGKAVFRDCQTNEVMDIKSTLEKVSEYEYVRVDNLEPTEEVLRTVRNRKKR